MAELAGNLSAFTGDSEVLSPNQIGGALARYATTEQARKLTMPHDDRPLLDKVYNDYHREGIKTFEEYR